MTFAEVTVPSILVVGASSSIGSYVCARLQAWGRRVVGTSRASLDLADLLSVEVFAERVRVRYEDVDAVVVVAGVLPGKRLDEYSDEEVDRVVAVNLVGPIRLLRGLLPKLREGARVVLVSSLSAETGSYDPVYAASKAGLVGLARSINRGPLRACTVLPGLVEGSGMYLAMAPEVRERHVELSPTGRLTTIDEVAGLIAGLACGDDELWRQVKGSCVRIVGGQVGYGSFA